MSIQKKTLSRESVLKYNPTDMMYEIDDFPRILHDIKVRYAGLLVTFPGGDGDVPEQQIKGPQCMAES